MLNTCRITSSTIICLILQWLLLQTLVNVKRKLLCIKQTSLATFNYIENFFVRRRTQRKRGYTKNRQMYTIQAGGQKKPYTHRHPLRLVPGVIYNGRPHNWWRGPRRKEQLRTHWDVVYGKRSAAHALCQLLNIAASSPSVSSMIEPTGSSSTGESTVSFHIQEIAIDELNILQRLMLDSIHPVKR